MLLSFTDHSLAFENQVFTIFTIFAPFYKPIGLIETVQGRIIDFKTLSKVCCSPSYCSFSVISGNLSLRWGFFAKRKKQNKLSRTESHCLKMFTNTSDTHTHTQRLRMHRCVSVGVNPLRYNVCMDAGTESAHGAAVRRGRDN